MDMTLNEYCVYMINQYHPYAAMYNTMIELEKN